MDTQQAISTLTALKSTIESNLSGLSAQVDSLSVAIAQLEGTLTVQAVELENKYKAQIDDLTKQAAIAQNVVIAEPLIP